MAMTKEDKMKFVELRGKGWSFDKIAEEMKVSKPTLLKLNGDLFEEVKEAQYFETEAIVEQYGLMRKERLKIHCNALKKAMGEFKKKVEEQDFEEMPIEKLYTFIEQLEKRIEKDTDRERLEIAVIPPDFSFYTDTVGID